MLFLHDGELVHADRGSDVLEHYGVKGMRWGKRLGGYSRSLGKAVYNNYRHPIASSRASASAKKNVGKLNYMFSTKKSLDYMNSHVDRQLAASKAFKDKKKALKANKKKAMDKASTNSDRKSAKQAYKEAIKKQRQKLRETYV